VDITAFTNANNFESYLMLISQQQVSFFAYNFGMYDHCADCGGFGLVI